MNIGNKNKVLRHKKKLYDYISKVKQLKIKKKTTAIYCYKVDLATPVIDEPGIEIQMQD